MGSSFSKLTSVHPPVTLASPPEALTFHVRLWAWSRWLYRKKWRRSARVLKGVNFFLHGCLLPPEAEVGRCVRLDHYGHGVVLHPNVRIGNHVRIFHGVTVAAQNAIGSEHSVVLEDRVVVGARATIIGRRGQSLTVGEGAVVGAGAVLTRDIPPGERWAGVPASKL